MQEGEVIFELPLNIAGMLYDGSMPKLMAEDKKMKAILIDHGYQYQDPPV